MSRQSAPFGPPLNSRELPHNTPSNTITDVIQDLTVSDNEEIGSMASKIESKLIGNTVSRHNKHKY